VKPNETKLDVDNFCDEEIQICTDAIDPPIETSFERE